MTEAPDPDPLTKVIAVLRTAIDELARLAEHPTVKSTLDTLIHTFRPSGPPVPAAAEPSTPGAEPSPAAGAAATPKPAAKRSRRKPSAPAASPAAVGARPKGRRGELLAMIELHPGVTIPAAADQIGVAPGGLYPVARKLEADGLIRKDGAGWHRTDAAAD